MPSDIGEVPEQEPARLSEASAPAADLTKPYLPTPAPFIIEALVTAGPRKLDTRSTELCEDCLGFCWVEADRLVFWLCDGASLGRVLPRLPIVPGEEIAPPPFGFSARILARDLGQAFVEHICALLREETDVMAAPAPLDEVFDHVAAAWTKHLCVYVSLSEKRGQLSTLLKRFAEDGIDKSRSAVWSTTFLGGVFAPRERTLTVWNYGDSGALVMGEERAIVLPNTNRVMLSARLQIAEQRCIQVSAMPAASKLFWQRFTDVRWFAALSDGASRTNLVQHLKRLTAKQYGSFSEFRTVILYSADDQTWDDKAVLFGRFIGDQLMDVLLSYGGQTAILTLSPDILDLDNWVPSKRYCAHRPFKDTGLAAPFAHVFLKRWIGMKAPAHSFLEQICGVELPGTPRMLGLGQEGKDWIYVFEHLPNTYWQLNELLASTVGDKWLTVEIMLAVVGQAVQTFATFEPYHLIYTDFSSKNMMVDPPTSRFMFIDLDSAWSRSFLVGEKGRPNENQFDTRFWILWDYYLRERHWDSRRATELLPRSMVLSFAAVWGHALGLLANPQLPEAKELLQRRSVVDWWKFASQQELLWEAMTFESEERFWQFFLLPSSPARQQRHEDLFDQWLGIFSSLVHGDYVPWPQIQEATQTLAREFLPEVKPQSPSSGLADWM